MSAGLLKGLGAGLATAGDFMMRTKADELKEQRLRQYQLEAEARQNERQDAVRDEERKFTEGQWVDEKNEAGVITGQRNAHTGELKPFKSSETKGFKMSDGIIMNEATGEYIKVPGWEGDSPSAVQEFQFFQSLPPEKQSEFLNVKRATPVKDFGGYIGAVNQADGSVQNVGDKTLAPDKELEYVAAAAGEKVRGKNAAESEAARPAAETAIATQRQSGDSVLDIIDGAIGKVSLINTGVIGKTTGVIPGTPSYDFRRDVATIKANLGFDKLQSMRDSSPTGGALGQVSERELDFLQSTVASLDEGQSPDQMIKNLGKVREHYNNWLEIQEASHAMKYGNKGAASSGQSMGGQSQTQGSLLGAPQAPRTQAAPMSALRALYANPDKIQDFEEKFGYRPEGF